MSKWSKGGWTLVLLGFLKVAYDLEWGARSLAQSKPKPNREIFPSDFINLNRQLNRKPYFLPKISAVLLKLEGFQYTNSLGLNMGYYHTWISNNSSNLCKIILP